MIEEFGSLARYVWQFEPPVKDHPRRLDWKTIAAATSTPQSIAMSKDLKRRGWSFVGPTTIHAFMQAMGLVNDHVTGCCTRQVAEAARHRAKRPQATAG